MSLAELGVAAPRIVFYGCTPWTPDRDVDYRDQAADGGWPVPVPGRKRRRCRWCRDNPAAAGLDLCPGCQGMPSRAESVLAYRRWCDRNRAAEDAAAKGPAQFVPRPDPAARRRARVLAVGSQKAPRGSQDGPAGPGLSDPPPPPAIM